MSAAIRGTVFAVFLTAFAMAATPPASAQNSAAGGKAEVERIVRDYLLKNPEIIVEAFDAYKKKREAAEQAAVTAALRDRKTEIETDPNSPVGGNPLGDVTVVEFFDYRCGVCKRVHPIVTELIKSDSKIRRIYKEWPILGPTSVYAARAALASRSQGKYLVFHDAMMASRTNLTPQAVLVIAKNVGLDTDRLTRDMKDRKIAETLNQNFKLAKVLRINGTPSFIIGDTLIRGARDLDTLRKLVADARGAKAR
ncbi:MAG: DsbA family protein [Alphaproteobacteria bacterium]